MKKFNLCMAITFSGISCAQALTCGHSILNDDNAKSCAEDFLTQEAETQTFLRENGHLGDIKDCQGTQETIPHSYFREDMIDTILKTATVENCIGDGATYNCFVNLKQNACFITQNGTRSKTMRAIIKVETETGNLHDFYPIKKQ